MSRKQGLDDQQVQAELDKMVAFIHQEAKEKAAEIRLKADEEFNSEKVKLINTEREAITAEFKKKRKLFESSQQIAKSTIANQTRLAVLACQSEKIDELFAEAEDSLKEIQNDHEAYKEMVRKLILEGLYCITETKMSVQARKKDWDMVRGLLDGIKEEYKKGIDGDDNLRLDEVMLEENYYLEDDSAGGVIITGYAGRIQVDNTLKQRLELCKLDALPEVRRVLLGENPNRKFKD